MRVFNKKISIEDWKKETISKIENYPEDVSNKSAYRDYLKVSQYLDSIDNTFYYQLSDSEEVSVSLFGSIGYIHKFSEKYKLSQYLHDELFEYAIKVKKIIQVKTNFKRKAFNVVGGSRISVLDKRRSEIIEMYGRLMTSDEILKKVNEDFGLGIKLGQLGRFYTTNYAEIQKVREDYESSYTDITLTKKRGRLDKKAYRHAVLSKRFKDEGGNVSLSKELGNIEEQIRKEVEGETLKIDINGQINVNATLSVNKKLSEIQREIPVNEMVVGLVAAKQGINPLQLMTSLSSSMYSKFNGFGIQHAEVGEEPPQLLNLSYNWKDIEQAHKKSKENKIEDVDFEEISEDEEREAETNKEKLLKLLNQYK